MAKGRHKKQGKAGRGRYQSLKSGPKGPSGPDTRVEGVPKKIPGGHSFPVPGLANLGNTCFFNAVLQNISQSHYLRVRLDHLISSPSYTTELKISGSGLSRQLTVAEQPGPLTKVLNSFLSQMVQQPGRSLNPRPLFSEICRKAPRFSSFQQQDSQELLRYLLDSMRSEEIYRIKRAILGSFSVGKKDPSSNKKVTDKDREDIKAYGREADLASTFVDEVFGGALHSMMHETFLDLSLPIPEDKSQQKTPSPGYQARGRKNKKGGEGGGYKIGKYKVGEEKALPTAKETTVSKHQQKKARKQQAKGAKKSKSTTKSLQDFLREGSEADTTPSQKEEAKGEKTQQDNPPENAEVTKAERAKPTTTEMVFGGIDDTAGENDENARENDENVRENDDNTGENDDNAGRNAEENDDYAKENVYGDNSIGEAGVGTCEAAGESEPLTPSDEEQSCIGDVESLADELATIKVADECQNDTTLANESQQALGLRENVVKCKCTPDIVQARSDSQHLNTQTVESLQTASQRTSNTAASKEAAANKGASNAPDENFQLHSLQASLKKFCAPELLTGKNKFACIFCTKKKIEETTANEMLLPKSSQVRAAPGAAENEMEVSTDEKEERNVSQRTQKESPLESHRSLLAPPNSDSEAEDEVETRPKSNAHRYVEEVTSDLNLQDNQLGEVTKEGRESENGGSEVSGSEGEGDNCEESNEGNSHEESNKESDDDDAVEEVPKTKAAAGKGTEKVVFSEATKQLLIESPPLVLNLHLKRFLQSGRHLRKNNKHISFPIVLDMRPFCTPKCQPLCDGKGELLYSLYGVVEHSGGMHGGHYTAYVRVRKPPTTSERDPTTAASTASRGSPLKTASTTSECDPTKAASTTSACDPTKAASTTSACDPTMAASTTSKCDSTKATLTACKGSLFETASTTSECDPTTAALTTSECDPNERIPPTIKCDPPLRARNTGASIVDMSTQAPTPNSETQCTSSAVEVATLEGENRKFDLSSTTGHWYYISDGHVRTATESEVLKSQAYLLFYERLPFQHQDVD